MACKCDRHEECTKQGNVCCLVCESNGENDCGLGHFELCEGMDSVEYAKDCIYWEGEKTDMTNETAISYCDEYLNGNINDYDRGFLEKARDALTYYIEWHDLRENKNDLPAETGSYLVTIETNEDAFVLNAWFDSHNSRISEFFNPDKTDKGWHLLNEWYSLTEMMSEHIVAWAEWPEPFGF